MRGATEPKRARVGTVPADSTNDESSVREEESQPLMRIQRLGVSFRGATAVKDVSLEIYPGEVLGVAGQSGSGKSMTALAVMGLLPSTADVTGSIVFDEQELLGKSEAYLRGFRGNRLTMIFQETKTALNPVVTIGRQLVLAIKANTACTVAQAEARAIESLASVRLNDSKRVMASYPHELSGGMCQRVMIAMALACGAELLFADEPTTALDVTVQREVLDVVKEVVRTRRLAVVFISHDLGVLEEVADRLVIMKDGEIVEAGSTASVMADPQHPYTQALLFSVPRIAGDLIEFPEPPDLIESDATTGARSSGRWRRMFGWGRP